MTAYWVTFANGEELCVEAMTEDLARERVADREVSAIAKLPYPATPRLKPAEQFTVGGREYSIPAFCYKPRECAGRSSCPQRYSCSE